MKKIITTIAAMFVATAAYADKVQIVNAGSEEGAFRQVLSAIADKVENDFVQANNPVTASTYFGDKPSLTVWSSEWPGDTSINSPEINEKNLVALMTYETLMCSREFTSLEDMAGKEVKIATWGSKPVARFLATLEEKTGANFVVVPFGGSGSTGDADTVFTITTRQAAIEEDDATKCFAFSANGDLGFRFVDAIATVNAPDKLTGDITKVVSELKETEEWKNNFAGTVTYTDDKEKLNEMFDEAVKNFTP
jgi:hypothetical protein